MISALREKESLVLIQDIPEEQSFHKPDKQEKLLTVIVKEEAGKRTILKKDNPHMAAATAIDTQNVGSMSFICFTVG